MSGNDCINHEFLKFVVESGLHQFVDIATRGNNVLDVIHSDDPLLIHSLISALLLGRSDHVMIEFTVNQCPQVTFSGNSQCISQV